MLIVVACLLTACSNVSLAEGFRIETKIYVGDEKEPASETKPAAPAAARLFAERRLRAAAP